MRLAGFLTGAAFGLLWGLSIGVLVGGFAGYRSLRRVRRQEDLLDHLDRTTSWNIPKGAP